MSLFGSITGIFAAEAQKSANNKAIGAFTEENQNARDALAGAGTDSREAVNAGADASLGYSQDEIAQGSPGVSYLRGVVKAPMTLNPFQQQQIQRARQQTAMSLNASGLRGSGRAIAAAARDVEGNVTGGFLQSNAQRADQAATTLSGLYGAGTGRAAGTEETRGARLASSFTHEGDATAGEYDRLGDARAGKYVANGKLTGSQINSAGNAVSSAVSGNYFGA